MDGALLTWTHAFYPGAKLVALASRPPALLGRLEPGIASTSSAHIRRSEFSFWPHEAAGRATE